MAAQTQAAVQPPVKGTPSEIAGPSHPASGPDAAARLRGQLALNTFPPVNQNGSFEFDRVIKSGVVMKRTQKTKTWKSVFLVLRPNTLSIYKTEKEDKLRHMIYLNDLTAVAFLKDPKHKRQNVFGLFSPSRNFHFEAPSAAEAQEWVELIRKDARIEEEEEEMFLASPIMTRQNPIAVAGLAIAARAAERPSEHERMLSSSPEGMDRRAPNFAATGSRKLSHTVDSSGLSGNELVSHSDFSDNDVQRQFGPSFENLALQTEDGDRPSMGNRNSSQVSAANVETDPDRVFWQGKLWLLRNKGGVRQWKKSWAVLRPRNLILYRDQSEYTAQFIIPLSVIVNAVDIDPISKTKAHCLQVITEEKSYKFCAQDEEALVHCLGAFKSLFAKRRELEARVAAAATTAATSTPGAE
jgi:hypothetical protein